MTSGSLSQKRIFRNLEERYAAGNLNVNALDGNGLSLVHQFCYDGQLMGLQWTLSHGGSLLARSSEGCVAAHYAAAGGHLHILQYLQEHTTQSIDVKDDNGTCPLYIAAQEGQLDCVMWLTKYSSLPASEPSNDGMTPVHASAQEGNLDCIRYLVQFARCSAIQTDHTGCTPLHFASAEGHWKVARWLLEISDVQGDEVDKTGTAAIHLAAEYNRLKVLKVFVKLRSSLLVQKDGSGRSPLDICTEKGHTQCLDFLKNWQGTNTNQVVRHRSSLKKVRFDEDNGRNIPSNDTARLTVNNNNDFNIENGYMIIPGGSSDEQLRERMRRKKEEWARSNMNGVELQENGDEGSNKKSSGIGGSRNVRKRSSFKDKNAKYRARMRELNRGSIGHILDRLNIRKGLNTSGRGDNMYASLPYRTGERGSRPDLIQSAMDADKRAGKEFTRRPSLEFFQDLRSQLNSGRKQEQTKVQRSDVPVTIFHNGTLRASRDNLQTLDVSDDVMDRTSDSESSSEKAAISDENMTQLSEDSSVSDVPISRIGGDSSYRVVINGAELKNKNSVENRNETNSAHTVIGSTTQEPHVQRKIKLPKGFNGILPKYRPQPQSTVRERTSSFDKVIKTFTRSKRNEGTEANFSTIRSSNVVDDEQKEHYLVRTLPLPSLGSHGGAKSERRMSADGSMDNKQNFSRWSSVRESVGSFFSSMRSVKKRDKVYKVQSVQNVSNLYGSNDSLFERKDSGKFKFIKSMQLKTKKRKSLSLEHLPYYSSSGEHIRVSNGNQNITKRLASLQPGYTEPDISKLTSMALDQTLKGRVGSVEPVEDDQIPPPEPEESLDFVVSNKQTTGFELESLQVNNTTDGMETGKALMW